MHCKHASNSNLGRNCQLAAEDLSAALGDRKPQPSPPDSCTNHLRTTIERLKNSLQVRFTDSDTTILDSHQHCVLVTVHARGDADPPIRTTVLDGIDD